MKRACLGFLLLALSFGAHASTVLCAAPAAATNVAVPGHPFAAAPTSDGCWVFVSLEVGKGRGAVAVLHNQGGSFTLAHVVGLAGEGFGEALSHDGRLLAVTGGEGTALLDVAALERGEATAALGLLRSGSGAGAVYALFNRDDSLLFVSDEDAQRLSVFDLAKARAEGYSGKTPPARIPVGIGPVGLALSPDGRWLFGTSQVAAAGLKLPATCQPETREEQKHPPGLLFRLDVDKAMADPAHAIAAALPAGCNPVRVAVSPSGELLWVTARGDGALLRFRIKDWLGGSERVDLARFPMGASPVGVAVRPDGKQVWLTLSNRFGSADAGQLVGLQGGLDGAAAMQRLSISAPGFPRELSFLPDGHTLVATRFEANQVMFVATASD